LRGKLERDWRSDAARNHSSAGQGHERLLVVAKHDAAHIALSAQFASRKVEKFTTRSFAVNRLVTKAKSAPISRVIRRIANEWRYQNTDARPEQLSKFWND